MSYNIKCEFCGTLDDQKVNFFKTNSSNHYICESCVHTFHLAQSRVVNIKKDSSDSLITDDSSQSLISQDNLPSPNDVFDFMSKSVIGQISAKKSLSIAVSHHYRRLLDPSIGKSNVLLIGPTGTGKTELARSISQFLKVPFTTADATNFTSKGYVGDDIESIILRLVMNADWDIQKAEQGIVFIDEIDKIIKRGNSVDSGVNTTAVQQELLRILEGDKIKLNKPSKTSPTGFEQFFVNTKNILFICAGAFVGLKELVKKQKIKPVGLSSVNALESVISTDDNDWYKSLESSHLKEYGMIPELIGRLPVLSVTNQLTKKELLNIITEPENAISKQYKKLFALDKVDLNFSEDFYEDIAEEAIKKDLGARGIRLIFEKKMHDTFFDIQKYKNHSLLMNSNGQIRITKSKS